MAWDYNNIVIFLIVFRNRFYLNVFVGFRALVQVYQMKFGVFVP